MRMVYYIIFYIYISKEEIPFQPGRILAFHGLIATVIDAKSEDINRYTRQKNKLINIINIDLCPSRF